MSKSADALDLYAVLIRYRSAALSAIDHLVSGRYWLLKVTALSVLVSLAITFPRISFFWGDSQIVNMWTFIEWQSQNLLQPIPAPSASHESKRMFRLFLPVLIRVTDLPWWSLIGLQYVVGVLATIAAGAVAYRHLQDRACAALFLFALCQILTGKIAYLGLGGLGDGFALAFLIFAIFFRNSALVFLFALLACFTDERAAIATSFAAMYHFYRADRSGFSSPPFWAVICAVAACLLFRAYAEFVLNAYLPAGERALPLIVANSSLIHLELPASLAGLWIQFFLGAIALMRARDAGQLFLILLTMGMLVAAAMAVEDIDRSLAYLFPVLFLMIGRPDMPKDQEKSVYLLAALICLATPVNAFVGVQGPVARYAEGNIAPVEFARAWHYANRNVEDCAAKVERGEREINCKQNSKYWKEQTDFSSKWSG